MFNKSLYYLGNLCIGVSILGFFITFLPFGIAYLFPAAKTVVIAKNEMSIEIPKINAKAKVIANVDASNEEVYKKALRLGVAQAKGTSFPPEKGKTFLFAHSSGMPWELTNTNTLFLRLSELKNGDEIILRNKNITYRYKVYDSKTVWPTEVTYLNDNKNKNELILQTCTPIGTDLKRLLVFAQPI